MLAGKQGIYTQPKKNVAIEKSFFHYLEFDCKILYHWKAYILNFSSYNFFFILKIFWVINFRTKIVYFFTISKNVIYPTRIKKKFFLWKVLVSLVILQKSFYKKMSSLMMIWWSQYDIVFRTVNFFDFIEILSRFY